MTALIVKLESISYLLVRLSVKSAQVELTLLKWQSFVLLALQGHIPLQSHLQAAQSAPLGDTHQVLVAEYALIANGESTMSAQPTLDVCFATLENILSLMSGILSASAGHALLGSSVCSEKPSVGPVMLVLSATIQKVPAFASHVMQASFLVLMLKRV